MKYTAYVITKPKEEGECKWCDKAWRRLRESDVVDGVVESPLPQLARIQYYASNPFNTIPQIYMVDEDGFSEHVGGYDELVVWLEKRKK